MNRLPLAAQISLIFTAAFLITSLLLGIFITRRLDELYENTIYERLETEARAIRFMGPNDEYGVVENIAYIKYFSSDSTYYVSENMMEYIDEDAISRLIGKALAQKTYQSSYKNTVNDNVIYYVVLNYQGVLAINEDVTIVIADNTLKNEMIYRTRRQIFLVCIISFSLGYIIIIFWITKFASDTKKISITLKNIGDNYYSKKVETKRKDEVGELVQSIEHMRLKIIETEMLRQEIIQGVSHDLKTPIALISSYVEAYEDGMCEDKELVKIAKKETQRLNSKVTKLLNLTRLGYINKNLKTVGKTNMKSLIKEMVKSYTYQTRIEIITKLSESSFVGDKESWYIAVQNILDNAMRYAKSKIIIELEKDRVAIANDGDAIDEEMLPLIFQAYSKGKGGLTGIGLSIVKTTVELFGYSVKAENTDDGVLFVIEKK